MYTPSFNCSGSYYLACQVFYDLSSLGQGLKNHPLQREMLGTLRTRVSIGAIGCLQRYQSAAMWKVTESVPAFGESWIKMAKPLSLQTSELSGVIIPKTIKKALFSTISQCAPTPCLPSRERFKGCRLIGDEILLHLKNTQECSFICCFLKPKQKVYKNFGSCLDYRKQHEKSHSFS